MAWALPPTRVAQALTNQLRQFGPNCFVTRYFEVCNTTMYGMSLPTRVFRDHMHVVCNNSCISAPLD